jgi:CheY-like chemotaxis protein
MLRRLIGEHITLVIAPAPHPVRVRADPGQLQQVIMNLAVNARDSMKDGGTLTVTTSRAARGSEPDPERPGLAAGEWALLSVKDTGAGMEEETLRHIFEPFFTTKEKGKGTGLGLSTVYGIVAQSGGMVFVRSSPGAGATFEIFLPWTTDEIERDETPQSSAETAPGTHPDAPPPRASGRILLVEDEKPVRELTRSILAKAGYTVMEAGNGQEALTVHASVGGAIDLLLTDVIMPGMGGAELARQLCAVYPDLEVIFISGYSEDQLGAQGKLGEGIHLLRKPFNAAELLATIARVKGAHGAP